MATAVTLIVAPSPTPFSNCYMLPQNSALARIAVTYPVVPTPTPTLTMSATRYGSQPTCPNGTSIVTNDHSNLYLSSFCLNTITKFNLSSGVPTASTSVSISGPGGPLAISSDDRLLLAARFSVNSIDIFKRDTTTGELTAPTPTPSISFSGSVYGVAIHGSRAYVATAGNKVYTYVIDTSAGTLTPEETLDTGSDQYYGFLFSPDGKYVYAYGNVIGTYDISTKNKLVSTISKTTAPTPFGNMAISPNGGNLYAAPGGTAYMYSISNGVVSPAGTVSSAGYGGMMLVDSSWVFQQGSGGNFILLFKINSSGLLNPYVDSNTAREGGAFSCY